MTAVTIKTNGQTLLVSANIAHWTSAALAVVASTDDDIPANEAVSITADYTMHFANTATAATVTVKQADGTTIHSQTHNVQLGVGTAVINPVPDIYQVAADLTVQTAYPSVSKVATMDRGSTSFADGNAATSGTLFLNYFTAPITLSVDQMEIHTGGTAAAATPTLCRLAIFEENAAAGISAPVAATASDTALFGSTNTKYTKALAAAYTIRKGQRYAFGVLVVSGGAVPTFVGRSQYGQTFVDNLLSESPRVCGAVASLTDLPEAVTATGSIAASRRNYYIAASHS